jgi:hypothetical protein
MPRTIPKAILDTGATDTLVSQTDQSKLNQVYGKGIIHVNLPNGNKISSVMAGKLILHPKLPPIKAHVFDKNDLDRSLISVADLCNEGCEVSFTATKATVIYEGQIILQCSKQPQDKLWEIDLSSTNIDGNKTSSTHNVVSHTYNAEKVAWHHAALGSPPLNTLIRALRMGYLGNIPDIDAKMVQANPPRLLATAMGHLDMNRQHFKPRIYAAERNDEKVEEDEKDEDISTNCSTVN